jgi:hypothetical protein
MCAGTPLSTFGIQFGVPNPKEFLQPVCGYLDIFSEVLLWLSLGLFHPRTLPWLHL